MEVPLGSGNFFCARHAGMRRLAALSFVVDIDAFSDELCAENDVGEMAVRCEHCRSLNFALEQVGRPPHFQLCCRNGKLAHPELELPMPPPVLAEYLQGGSIASRKFKSLIREYNAALSFVDSLGLSIFLFRRPLGPDMSRRGIFGGVFVCDTHSRAVFDTC